STLSSILGNNGSIGPSRAPASSTPAFSPIHDSAFTPSMLLIRPDADGITGSTSDATTLSASAALYNVASRTGRDSGVFASAHGSRATMYLLRAEISSHVSRKAWLKSKAAAAA